MAYKSLKSTALDDGEQSAPTIAAVIARRGLCHSLDDGEQSAPTIAAGIA